MTVSTTLPQEAAPVVDIDALVADLGALPRAPLAMPKQRLEHEAGVLRRLLRIGPFGPARPTRG